MAKPHIVPPRAILTLAGCLSSSTHTSCALLQGQLLRYQQIDVSVVCIIVLRCQAYFGIAA